MPRLAECLSSERGQGKGRATENTYGYQLLLTEVERLIGGFVQSSLIFRSRRFHCFDYLVFVQSDVSCIKRRML